MGDAHAEGVCVFDVDMVVADGARRDCTDTQLVVAVEELGRHGVRDDGKHVCPTCEVRVLECGVFCRPAELEPELPAEPFKVSKLVKRAKREREELHGHSSRSDDLSPNIDYHFAQAQLPRKRDTFPWHGCHASVTLSPGTAVTQV